jgi:hypothetical protein
MRFASALGSSCSAYPITWMVSTAGSATDATDITVIAPFWLASTPITATRSARPLPSVGGDIGHGPAVTGSCGTTIACRSRR